MLTSRSLLVGLAFPSALAAAQPMASVTVTANGGASAIVQPGEAVTIHAQLWQNQYSFAGVQGGTVITGHAGQSSNFSTTLPGLPTMNFGNFQGGSRVNADLALTPPGFLVGPTPPQGFTTFPIWQYSLVLDTPGDYHINWVAPASAPNIRLYQTVASFSFIEAQSTYIGATITVVPAPATTGLLASAAVSTRRRRR